MWLVNDNRSIDTFKWSSKGATLKKGPRAPFDKHISAYPKKQNGYNDYFDDSDQDNVYEYTETEIRGLKSLISFQNDYLISNINIGIYSSDNSEIDDNHIPLNSYSNYSILFSPKINKKRFRPFIGVSGSYMDLNHLTVIDPYDGF